MGLKIIFVFLASVIMIVTGPICSLAAENQPSKGCGLFDKPMAPSHSIQTNCYESAKYLVVARETQGKSGTDLLIKYKSNPRQKFACHYVPGQGDFEIKNQWAEYFAGLKRDLLILDSTTGPGPSGLIIWDLKRRKKVYEGSWSDPEESKNNMLVFWKETSEATDTNCPEYKKWKSNGLEAAIETKVILNLSNFKMTKTRETRCSPRQ